MFFPSGNKMTVRELKSMIDMLTDEELNKPIVLISDNFDGNVRHLEMVGASSDSISMMFSKNLGDEK